MLAKDFNSQLCHYWELRTGVSRLKASREGGGDLIQVAPTTRSLIPPPPITKEAVYKIVESKLVCYDDRMYQACYPGHALGANCTMCAPVGCINYIGYKLYMFLTIAYTHIKHVPNGILPLKCSTFD